MECCEAGGKPVAWGLQKGRIDVYWLEPERDSGGRVVRIGARKFDSVPLQHQRLEPQGHY